MIVKKVLTVFLILFWCDCGLAHTSSLQGSDSARFKNEIDLDGSLVGGMRSETGFEDALFTIPGNLMGGDPGTPTKGIALDEVLLMLQYRKKSGLHFEAEAGVHGHGDSEMAIELEQAFAGITRKIKNHLFMILQMGKMKGAFSPEIGKHTANRYFFLQPLPYSAFFGGHYVDDGIRFEILRDSSWIWGGEYWQGHSYPAGASDQSYAWDVFGYKSFGGDEQIKVGCWVHYAKALRRVDERLNGSHQHGIQSTNVTLVEFGGDQQTMGIHGSWRWNGINGLQGRIVGEWMSVELDGNVSDASRLSTLSGEHRGGWLQSELHIGKQVWAIHYSQLVLKNHLIGPGSAILIDETGLSSPSHNPNSEGISVQQQWLPELALRLEWQRVEMDQESDYWGISLLWQESLKYSF